MKLYFRPHITFVGLLLITIFVRASYWQWERHLEKAQYVEELEQRIAEPIVPLGDLLAEGDNLQKLPYRRVSVYGEFDFEHEVVLRNRRYAEQPGVHVLTPLKIDGLQQRLLVNRGFSPMPHTDRSSRVVFQRTRFAILNGILKEGGERRALAPSDPHSGDGRPWVDAWLRVDMHAIAAQLPYDLLPVYLEYSPDIDNPSAVDGALEGIVRSGAGREELLMLSARARANEELVEIALDHYPIPVFNTVVPAGRHLGYVYEWAAMAVVTFLICLVLQFRPPRGVKDSLT